MKQENYTPIKILSFLFPVIGVIFYFIESGKNPKKAKAILGGLKILFILIIVIIFIIISVMIQRSSTY